MGFRCFLDIRSSIIAALSIKIIELYLNPTKTKLGSTHMNLAVNYPEFCKTTL